MGIGAPQSCRSACCRMIGSRGAFCRPSAVAPGVPGTWGGGSMWSARVNRLRSYGTVIAKTGDLNMFCLVIAEAGMRFQARSHNCFRSRATMRGSAWGSRPMAAAAQGAACASAAGAGPAVLLQSGTVRRSPPAGGAHRERRSRRSSALRSRASREPLLASLQLPPTESSSRESMLSKGMSTVSPVTGKLPSLRPAASGASVKRDHRASTGTMGPSRGEPLPRVLAEELSAVRMWRSQRKHDAMGERNRLPAVLLRSARARACAG